MAAVSQPLPDPRREYDSRADMYLGKRALLYSIFHPKTVAVIGATERPGSLGNRTLAALSSSPSECKIFTVGPEQHSVLGIQPCASIAAVPAPVDLAVVVAPPDCVVDSVEQCAHAQVKAAIVISAGFEEQYRNNPALQQKIASTLRGSRMRLIGPGAAGVINPAVGLNATCGLPMPLGGTAAFLSQSQAIGGAILEQSTSRIVGFSAFVSVGAMVNVGWGDLIDYFGSDPDTESIVIYMESIDNARSFLSAAREVSLNKPIIVIKTGRSQTAIDSAGRYSDSSTSDDEVMEAAFQRVGVLQVRDIDDLFSMADVLSKQPRPLGPRLMVVSNSASAGVVAADMVIGTGGELARLSPTGQEELNKALGQRNNDISGVADGDGSPEVYIKMIEIAANDTNCDGLLLLTLPQCLSDARKATDLLLTMGKPANKPILACFMGGENATAQELLTRACIPTFSSTSTAVRAFNYMWQYSYSLRGIYETPVLHSDVTQGELRQLAAGIIDGARDSGRRVLTDPECNQLLAAYRIATPQIRVANTEEDAIRIAGAIGYPVLLKAVYASSSEQDEFESMPLKVFDADAIRGAWQLIESRLAAKASPKDSVTISLQPVVELDGYEFIVASKIDPQFGPVLMFGLGGKLSEVFQDRAVGLPPLNSTLARRIMEHTRIYSALGGRKSVDPLALEGFLVRFSQLVVEQRWIKEIEINPLLASPQGPLAVNARVVVHGPEVREDQLTKPAIRPYPTQHVCSWTMKDGQAVTFRPIRPEDEPLMVKFHEGLSEKSVYLRYFQAVGLRQRTAHDRLTRICFIDYDREMALVAERRDSQTEERQIVALGNLLKIYGRNIGEIAVITRDDYQGKGLATEMFRRLVCVAREEKLQRVMATTMAENRAMYAVMKRLGFHLSVNFEDQEVEGILDL